MALANRLGLPSLLFTLLIIKYSSRISGRCVIGLLTCIFGGPTNPLIIHILFSDGIPAQPAAINKD